MEHVFKEGEEMPQVFWKVKYRAFGSPDVKAAYFASKDDAKQFWKASGIAIYPQQTQSTKPDRMAKLAKLAQSTAASEEVTEILRRWDEDRPPRRLEPTPGSYDKLGKDEWFRRYMNLDGDISALGWVVKYQYPEGTEWKRAYFFYKWNAYIFSACPKTIRTTNKTIALCRSPESILGFEQQALATEQNEEVLPWLPSNF